LCRGKTDHRRRGARGRWYVLRLLTHHRLDGFRDGRRVASTTRAHRSLEGVMTTAAAEHGAHRRPRGAR
jgi:hypothetical protein